MAIFRILAFSYKVDKYWNWVLSRWVKCMADPHYFFLPNISPLNINPLSPLPRGSPIQNLPDMCKNHKFGEFCRGAPIQVHSRKFKCIATPIIFLWITFSLWTLTFYLHFLWGLPYKSRVIWKHLFYHLSVRSRGFKCMTDPHYFYISKNSFSDTNLPTPLPREGGSSHTKSTNTWKHHLLLLNPVKFCFILKICVPMWSRQTK